MRGRHADIDGDGDGGCEPIAGHPGDRRWSRAVQLRSALEAADALASTSPPHGSRLESVADKRRREAFRQSAGTRKQAYTLEQPASAIDAGDALPGHCGRVGEPRRGRPLPRCGEARLPRPRRGRERVHCVEPLPARSRVAAASCSTSRRRFVAPRPSPSSGSRRVSGSAAGRGGHTAEARDCRGPHRSAAVARP